MYVIVWRYRVESGRDGAFRVAYGPLGDWTTLFGRSEGYAGTTLVALETAGEYLTLDRWADERSFHMFRQNHRAAHDELDQRLASLTHSEEIVGRGFEWSACDQNSTPE